MEPYLSSWNKINRAPFFTYLFLGIKLLIFILMEITGMRLGLIGGSENSQILFMFGAMSPETVVSQHEYWRFVTPIFVHIGLTHLAINSLSLYFVGRILEPIIGHTRFFILYLISGIMGNALSFAFGNPYGLSAGASTSLFGLFAAFIALGKMFKYHPMIRHMSQNMTLLIILNLVMNLFDSGVDILGHLGGAIGGILLMIALGVPKKSLNDTLNIHKRIAAGILVIFMIGFCIFYGFSFI